MEKVFKSENGFAIVRDGGDGALVAYIFAPSGEQDVERSGGTYKTLENALRYTARKMGGGELELIGRAENGKGYGIIRREVHGDRVGTWTLRISKLMAYMGESTSEVTQYRSEAEAWSAYDNATLRDTGAYDASKTLTLVVEDEDTIEGYEISEVVVARESYQGWAHHYHRDWHKSAKVG